MQPEVARYLQKVARSEEETICLKVEPYREATLEDMARAIQAVCETAVAILSEREDRQRVLDERVPPHATYAGILRRLRARVAGD